MTVENLAAGIVAMVVMFFVFTLVLLIPSLILMWAWNVFMPSMFGLPEVTFLQALALSVLLSFVKSVVSITFRKTKA